MKTVTTGTILILLILATGVFAAEIPTGSAPTHQQLNSASQTTGFTCLGLNPMQREIEEILVGMKEREEKLLKKLLAAKNDRQTNLTIRQIERLDVDRELAVLKVQAKYAGLAGRYDLQRKIKDKIMDILTVDMAMLN